MNLTPEQSDALGRFESGASMVLEAFAGTGKTTTILALAESDARRVRGTYVAYNRAIVDDVAGELAERAPQVKARTAHSLAYGQVGRHYRHRLNGERMSSREVAKLLRIDPLEVETRGQAHLLSPAFLAGCVTEAMRRFCNSAAPEPGPEHLPPVEAIDEPDKDHNDRAYRHHLAPALLRAWADLSATDGVLRFSHDCYLKLWQLGSASIPGDVLYVDEAQDVNPVLADVVERQSSQIVAVGDTYQQIYAWRGAIDAMADLAKRPGVDHGRLTHSFRFGPEVAAVANRLLARLGSPASITGAGGPSAVERSEKPDAILCRTNAGVVGQFMEWVGLGSIAVVGGVGELVRFAIGVRDLMTSGRSTHPELVCFASVEELLAYVADDPSGSDLSLLTKLCVRYGPDVLIDTLRLAVDEDQADLTLSTAHRAKGRQWPSVRLGPDWPDRTLDDASELRLAYVAVTRARSVLDLTLVPMLEAS